MAILVCIMCTILLGDGLEAYTTAENTGHQISSCGEGDISNQTFESVQAELLYTLKAWRKEKQMDHEKLENLFQQRDFWNTVTEKVFPVLNLILMSYMLFVCRISKNCSFFYPGKHWPGRPSCSPQGSDQGNLRQDNTRNATQTSGQLIEVCDQFRTVPSSRDARETKTENSDKCPEYQGHPKCEGDECYQQNDEPGDDYAGIKPGCMPVVENYGLGKISPNIESTTFDNKNENYLTESGSQQDEDDGRQNHTEIKDTLKGCCNSNNRDCLATFKAGQPYETENTEQYSTNKENPKIEGAKTDKLNDSSIHEQRTNTQGCIDDTSAFSNKVPCTDKFDEDKEFATADDADATNVKTTVPFSLDNPEVLVHRDEVDTLETERDNERFHRALQTMKLQDAVQFSLAPTVPYTPIRSPALVRGAVFGRSTCTSISLDVDETLSSKPTESLQEHSSMKCIGDVDNTDMSTQEQVNVTTFHNIRETDRIENKSCNVSGNTDAQQIDSYQALQNHRSLSRSRNGFHTSERVYGINTTTNDLEDPGSLNKIQEEIAVVDSEAIVALHRSIEGAGARTNARGGVIKNDRQDDIMNDLEEDGDNNISDNDSISSDREVVLHQYSYVSGRNGNKNIVLHQGDGIVNMNDTASTICSNSSSGSSLDTGDLHVNNTVANPQVGPAITSGMHELLQCIDLRVDDPPGPITNTGSQLRNEGYNWTNLNNSFEEIPQTESGNRPIYAQLRRMDEVLGYFSSGDSIEVYIDIQMTEPETLLLRLCQITGEGPEKFHIKDNTEQW